jgi:hypothetical protein
MKIEKISSTEELDPKFKEASLNDMELSDSEDDEDENDDVDFMIYRINTYEDPDQVLR